MCVHLLYVKSCLIFALTCDIVVTFLFYKWEMETQEVKGSSSSLFLSPFAPSPLQQLSLQNIGRTKSGKDMCQGREAAVAQCGASELDQVAQI